MERTPTPRVLIVSESSLEHINGVSGSVKRVAEYLHEHEYKAKIITPKPAPHGGKYAGFTVKVVPKFKMQGFNVGIPSTAMIEEEINAFQPDVIHVASPISKLGKTTIKTAAKLDVPTVAIYQTDVAQYIKRFASKGVERLPDNQLNWLKQLLEVGVDKLEAATKEHLADIHNRADLTLAPSQPAIQRLIDFGVESTKIKLWARGVDGELFTPDRKDSDAVKRQRQEWSRNSIKHVVGYIGRLAPEKSVHKLKELERLDDVQLVVVGDGPSGKELKQTLGEDTIFTGKLTGDDLANAYASLDVFVHTGADETFGQTLQEAMATELPVVAPAKGGPLDIVDNGTTGYLYKHDSNGQLVSSVETIIRDPELRLAMGRAGLAKVQGRTWSALGDELLGHYDDVIARRQSS